MAGICECVQFDTDLNLIDLSWLNQRDCWTLGLWRRCALYWVLWTWFVGSSSPQLDTSHIDQALLVCHSAPRHTPVKLHQIFCSALVEMTWTNQSGHHWAKRRLSHQRFTLSHFTLAFGWREKPSDFPFKSNRGSRRVSALEEFQTTLDTVFSDAGRRVECVWGAFGNVTRRDESSSALNLGDCLIFPTSDPIKILSSISPTLTSEEWTSEVKRSSQCIKRYLWKRSRDSHCQKINK